MLKKIKEIPKEISLIYIQAIIMPNGEILCLGKSLGFFQKSDNIFFEDIED
jgi:hypothetical protein